MNQPAADTRTFDTGDELPAITKFITQEKINRYAAVSGDLNPLHIHPDSAARGQFGGTVAHGMLILAYVSEMMTAAFGGWWDGKLKVRFRAPARPGDTVSTSGRVVRVEEKGDARSEERRVGKECRSR